MVNAPSQPVVPVRHYGQWIAAAVIVFLAAVLIHSLITNENYRWNVVAEYFFSPLILTGLWHTIELTVISMVIGVVLGVLLALMRQTSNRILSGAASIYIWVFRGTPVFVQLLIWGYLAALYPTLDLGVPFTEISFASVQTKLVMTTYLAAILGLSLNEGAYMAEIVRAGFSSVGKGQIEAGQALGMRRSLVLWRVILPQALQVIIPPTGNNVIAMLKTTSVVSVLAFPELLYTSQLIYAVNFQTIPLLIVASIWYLIVTSVLTLGQSWLERRFGFLRSKRTVKRTVEEKSEKGEQAS